MIEFSNTTFQPYSTLLRTTHCGTLSRAFARQDAEVRAVMQEVNGAEGVSRVQLILATSLWCAPSPTSLKPMRMGCLATGKVHAMEPSQNLLVTAQTRIVSAPTGLSNTPLHGPRAGSLERAVRRRWTVGVGWGRGRVWVASGRTAPSPASRRS